MSTAEEDRWNDVPEEAMYFTSPTLPEATRQEAMAAVLEAMENYKEPTFLERLRDTLWLIGYMLRFRFAMVFTRLYCRLTGKDTRLVSAKVWFRLNI